jgi:translation initiation factor 6
VSAIEKALKVPVKPATIGGLPQIGSLATASNKGVLANPIIEESEKKHISDALGVPVSVGTVNSGVPYPRSGIVVNSKGAVVGSHTLGSELLAVSTVFQTD